MTIEVCERLMYNGHGFNEKGEWVQTPKYHAQIKGKPGYWGCGDSRNEAIGSLMRSHSELFDVVFTDLEKESR